MNLERLLVWVVAAVAVAVTVVGVRHPPAPSEQVAILLLGAVVALPLAFVFARLLLAVPDRERGWRPR